MEETLRSCLIVNANPEEQEIFVHALCDTAPHVLCMLANNGREALDIMCEDNIVPNFVFIELSMPGIDAVEFLQEKKNIRSLQDAIIIVHTAEPVPHRVSELKAMGAHAIYSRPYNYWSVCNVLNLYLRIDNIRINLN